MKPILTLLAAALSALALTGAAGAAELGVADDRGKYADDGGAWFFSTLREAGMTVNRVTVQWDETRPTSIVELGFLQRSMPVAQAHGVKIVFAVYPRNPRALGASPAALGQFADFLALVARSYPQVREFVVGNEPNVNRFHQPQCSSAETYAQVLAAGYDALKAVDPRILVASSVSPRGNDNCNAASNPSASPVKFVKRLSDAYKASGRSRPLFDHFGLHVYPQVDTDPLAQGYRWPNAGFPNLDRVMQAVWDGFAGTAQPTFEEGVRFVLGEIGWQVAVGALGPAEAGPYFGRETARVTTEAAQASIYGEIASRYGCDPAIRSLLFFGLVDEPDLDRFQAGLMRADLTRRPSFDAVRGAIAAGCAARPLAWRHSTAVAGASADFGTLGAMPWRRQAWGLSAGAAEDATYTATLLRRTGKRLVPVAGMTAAGTATAYWQPRIAFPSRRLPAGTYAYRVTLRAAMNPARARTFTSGAFTVAAPPRARR